jgi:flagellar basal-body rod protein FlgB
MGSDGFDSTIAALNHSLNIRELNQNVISSNIANADTPEYKAKVVEFETKLRDALEANETITPLKTEEQMITQQRNVFPEPDVYEDPNGNESLDGNTVNRSSEMEKLATNQLLYDASIEMLKKKIGMLKYAINEGGGGH